MKLRLTSPLPQPEYGRVIPAGVVIDAPPALYGRLLRQNRGKPVLAEEAPGRVSATPPTAVSDHQKVGDAPCRTSIPGPGRQRRKK